MHAAAARAARQPQPEPRAASSTALPADRARRRRARSGTRTRPRVAQAGPQRPRPRRLPPPRNPLPGRSRPRRERARRAQTPPIRHARPRLRASPQVRTLAGAGWAATACSSALGPPDRAARGDRAQVLDQNPVDDEPALAEAVGQLIPEVPGSPRRGVARVPEEVDGSIPGEVLAYGAERRLRPVPEGSDVEGEDLVEAALAEVRVLQRDGLEHSPARVDVLAVPARGHRDHLGRAVDRGDRSRRQLLADQRDRDAVAASDLEQAVGRADRQRVDRPDEPLRCLARHAPAIASRAREAHADRLEERRWTALLP